MNITREEPDGDVVDAAVRIDVRRFIISLAVVVGIVECLTADDSAGRGGIIIHDCEADLALQKPIIATRHKT